MGILQTFVLHFQVFVQVDYATNKFFHAPTVIYNEVMRLFELVGMAEQA